MPITIDGTNGITQAGEFDSDSSFGFKNRIINGACVIAQRTTGSLTNDSSVALYPVDRFFIYGNVSSKFTAQQNAGSVTPPVGFTNYIGITSLSAYSIGSGDGNILGQGIEGFNIADLGWGTANAQPVTLSFWVRSSLTGTFGGAVQNNAQNRSYPFSYTISSANTWELKSITIVGDTTGTWVTNNGKGIQLTFGLGVGSTGSGTAGAWAASNFSSATGATSVVGTSGATFYITGVQLEKGSTATSFDYRPYSAELALCQRYFWYLGGSNSAGDQYLANGQAPSTTNARFSVSCPVSMRASPTVSAGTASNYQVYAGDVAPTVTSLTIGGASASTEQVTSFGLSAVVASGLTTGRGCNLLGVNTSAKITFSSEL
jgi:hypothetical protein